MPNGNVEIKLPKAEELTICCSKVGYMENGEFVLEGSFLQSGVNLNALRTANQLEQAAKRLESYADSGFLIETDEEGIAKLSDLDEGVYLLNNFQKQDGKVMQPTLLFLPTWDEAENIMLYDVTVIPKYGEKSGAPITGDMAKTMEWCLLFVISAIIFACKMKKIRKKE